MGDVVGGGRFDRFLEGDGITRDTLRFEREDAQRLTDAVEWCQAHGQPNATRTGLIYQFVMDGLAAFEEYQSGPRTGS
jgi:hypothetical protein